MPGRIEREISRMLGSYEGPGPRKCRPCDPSKIRAKERFESLCAELKLSNRAAAKLLDLDESSVRQWVDDRTLKHTPPQWAIERLAECLGSGVYEAVAYSYARSAEPDKSGTDD